MNSSWSHSLGATGYEGDCEGRGTYYQNVSFSGIHFFSEVIEGLSIYKKTPVIKLIMIIVLMSFGDKCHNMSNNLDTLTLAVKIISY